MKLLEWETGDNSEGLRYLWGERPKILRSSILACSNTRLRESDNVEPARFIYNVNIDMADRNGPLLRRAREAPSYAVPRHVAVVAAGDLVRFGLLTGNGRLRRKAALEAWRAMLKPARASAATVTQGAPAHDLP